MLDIQTLEYSRVLQPWEMKFSYILEAPLGYKITGGGGFCVYNNNGYGASYCHCTVQSDVLVPNWGSQGQDAWRYDVVFSNQNRGPATYQVRLICVAEIEPSVEDPIENAEEPAE